MARLIDADRLKENINGWYSFMREVRHLPNYTLKQDEIIGKIDMMDTVDAVPRSVLKDIKAELEDFLYHNALISPDHYDEVLAILDKHISRKEQDDGTDKRMFSK